MAFCSKCGNPIKQGEKFCASCGAPVESGAAKKSAPAKPTPAKPVTAKPVTAKKSSMAAVAGGAAMGKIALIVVTVACAVTVVFFFLPFFTVSFAGSNTSVNGWVTATNGDSRTGSASPALLLAWFLAIALLVALYVPIIREKLESVQLPVINVPVIGGLSIYAYLVIIIAFIGLIILIAAYASTMGYLRREFAGYGAALSLLGSTRLLRIHAGAGFVMTVIAHIVLLGIPFADKYFLSKRIGN